MSFSLQCFSPSFTILPSLSLNPHFYLFPCFPCSYPPPPSHPLPVWAGPCQGLCLSPSFDMPLIMVRWGNTTLCMSLSIFSLLYSSAHPLPCQNVMLLLKKKERKRKSIERELSEGWLCCIDTASRFFKHRLVYTFGCVCVCVHMHGKGGKSGKGLLTDSSWGRLSPLVTFPVSQRT